MIKAVAERPARGSPENRPEVMLINPKELREILSKQLATTPAQPETWKAFPSPAAGVSTELKLPLSEVA